MQNAGTDCDGLSKRPHPLTDYCRKRQLALMCAYRNDVFRRKILAISRRGKDIDDIFHNSQLVVRSVLTNLNQR